VLLGRLLLQTAAGAVAVGSAILVVISEDNDEEVDGIESNNYPTFDSLDG